MNIKEIYKELKRIQRGCLELGIAVGSLILSPMMFVSLTAVGLQVNHVRKVNVDSIIWLAICLLIMACTAFSGMFHILKYFVKKKITWTMSSQGKLYTEEYIQRKKHGTLIGGIMALILIALGILPVLLLSYQREFNANHIAGSWLMFFVGIALGAIIVTRMIFLLVILRRIEVEEDGAIVDEEINLRNIRIVTWIRIGIAELFVVALFVALGFYTGVWFDSIGILVVWHFILLLYIWLTKPFSKWHYLKLGKKKTIRRFLLLFVSTLVIAVVAMYQGSWYIQPYIATIPSVAVRECPIQYDKETGIYSIMNPEKGDFHILQITDVHLGGSNFSYDKDIRALEAVYELVESTKPDLVIMTGDFVFPLGIESFSFNNYVPIMQFASFMRNLGVPWAFTYGNHDTEFVASHSAEEVDELFQAFSYEKTQNLLYTDVQPEITGRSNQMIEVLNSDGSINQLLFLIDSNSYTGKGINDYDYIHDDQVEWYKQMVLKYQDTDGTVPSSLIFAHIPVVEYQDAYDLYKEGSNEVTYYHGKVGEAGEAICCGDKRSKLFGAAVELGSTKGMFVGHDHYNNISLEYQGIRLSYGMSIDYLAMPGISKQTEQRGATLITLKPDSEIEVENIPLTSIRK